MIPKLQRKFKWKGSIMGLETPALQNLPVSQDLKEYFLFPLVSLNK